MLGAQARLPSDQLLVFRVGTKEAQGTNGESNQK